MSCFNFEILSEEERVLRILKGEVYCVTKWGNKTLISTENGGRMWKCELEIVEKWTTFERAKDILKNNPSYSIQYYSGGHYYFLNGQLCE